MPFGTGEIAVGVYPDAVSDLNGVAVIFDPKSRGADVGFLADAIRL